MDINYIYFLTGFSVVFMMLKIFYFFNMKAYNIFNSALAFFITNY